MDRGLGASALDEISPLLAGFHRIQLLIVTLWGFSLERISLQTWSTLGNAFSTLVSLSLTSTQDTDMSSVAQVICAFPGLRNLSLSVSIPSTSPEPPSTMFRLPPLLDTLKLNTSAAAVLDWLLSRPVRPALRTVRLHLLEDSDLAIAFKFLTVFSNSLESLWLSTLIDDCTF